jgi:tetratricopeptide (TPR) repeat protein
MRGTWIVAMTLLVVLGTRPAAAGVYNTEEPWEQALPSPLIELPRADVPGAPLRLEPSPLKLMLNELRTLPKRPEETPRSDIRERYYRRVADLEARARTGGLTNKERVNLGAYYIRLLKYEQAAQVLEPAGREPGNFRALANLATAHHLAGRLDRALSYQRQLVAAWPDVVAGWTEEQRHAALRVEKYYLSLLQSRYQESLRPGRVAGLDPLFPGVRFTGRSGYEAGEMLPDSLAEVPPDALRVAVQLVVWLPFDDRVYWLLGELLNAAGHVVEAAEVLDELVFQRRYDPSPEIRQHRLVLMEARKRQLEVITRMLLVDDKSLLAASVPRGAFFWRGAAFASGSPYGLVSEVGWVTALRADAGAFPPPEPPAEPLPVAAWVPNWRQIGVSFVAGALVSYLVIQQWRQLRRPRTKELVRALDEGAKPTSDQPSAKEVRREARSEHVRKPGPEEVKED